MSCQQFSPHRLPDRDSASSTRLPDDIYVHYGCGLTAPAGWHNFDASPTLRWEQLPLLGKLTTKNPHRFPENVRFGDIVKGLPVPHRSCKGVFASHVLEHLTLDEFHIALRNTKQLMKPGAIFRAIVPDLEWAARRYVGKLEDGDPRANEFFLEQTRLGNRNRGTGLKRFAYQMWSRQHHDWMWDHLSLLEAFADHGYVHVRPCVFGDCSDHMFNLVEHPQRFEYSVAVEARVD